MRVSGFYWVHDRYTRTPEIAEWSNFSKKWHCIATKTEKDDDDFIKIDETPIQKPDGF